MSSVILKAVEGWAIVFTAWVFHQAHSVCIWIHMQGVDRLQNN